MNWFGRSRGLRVPPKTDRPRSRRKQKNRNVYVDVVQAKGLKVESKEGKSKDSTLSSSGSNTKGAEVFCTLEYWNTKQKHRTRLVRSPAVWNERHYFAYTQPTQITIAVWLYKPIKSVCLGKITLPVCIEELKNRNSWHTLRNGAGAPAGEVCIQIGYNSPKDEEEKQRLEESFVIRRSLVLGQPIDSEDDEEEKGKMNDRRKGSRIRREESSKKKLAPSKTDKKKGKEKKGSRVETSVSSSSKKAESDSDGDDSDESENSEDSDSDDSTFSLYSLNIDIPGYDPTTFIEFDEDDPQFLGLAGKKPEKRGSGGPKRSSRKDDEFDFQKDEAEDGKMDIDLSDWNGRFQMIIDKLRSFTYKTDHSAKMIANLDLIHLAQDFLYNAKVYGKIIISERHLDNENKTIKKVSVGGFAGGEKYIKNNILFKFALDSKSLFGDQADVGASKTGGHELKGLQCYFDCDVKDLYIPLMALVDYRGHRLIAMSILPIDESTLVLNSNDGGRHMHNKSPELQEKTKIAAEILNLKPHMAGIYDSNRILTYTAADCEGHRDKNGKFYLLDFARVLPPEAPKLELPQITQEDLKRCLYCRLRREFVKNYDKKLCSDAFSGFISGHERLICDLEIIEATKYLYEKVIPDCAQELPLLLYQLGKKEDKDVKDVAFSFFRLTETIHSRGVNMRHLGRIVASLKTVSPTITLSSPTLSTASSPVRSGSFSASSPPTQLLVSDCKRLLILEMFARVIKNYLQRELREKMTKFKTPLEEPYRRLVIKFLNCVFGNTALSERFWEERLKAEVVSKFKGWDFDEEVMEFRIQKFNQGHSPRGPVDSERPGSGNLGTDLLRRSRSASGQVALSQAILGFNYIFNSQIDGRLMLLLRVQKLMGLRFTPRSQKNFITNPQKLTFPNPFDASDLDEIGERIKHMNLFAHAEGYSLMMHGLRQRATGTSVAIPLLQQAIEKFEEALDTSFYSKVVLRDCASCLLHLHGEHVAQQNGVEKNESPLLERANLYYQSAIKLDPNDPTSLLEYAKFLDKCELLYQAEDYFLRVLELDSTFVVGLRYYGYFLEKLEQREEAEKFFIRAAETDYRRNYQRNARFIQQEKNSEKAEKEEKESRRDKEKH